MTKIFLLKSHFSAKTIQKNLYEKIKDEQLIIPVIEMDQNDNYVRTIYMYEKDVLQEQKEAEEYGFSRNAELYAVFSEADVVEVEIVDDG